ncbi:MAG: hypothetical protein KKC72_00115 [Alphaproteobacteria bacterium]|nr:hypothetical protein [Alphaproteobacteria bacterium]
MQSKEVIDRALAEARFVQQSVTHTGRGSNFASHPFCRIYKAYNFRPLAAVHHHLKMLRCGPSNQPFKHLAAFCRPNVGLRSKLAFAAGAKNEFGRVGIIIGGGEETLAGVILNAEII